MEMELQGNAAPVPSGWSHKKIIKNGANSALPYPF
jgi:hypothetical protein